MHLYKGCFISNPSTQIPQKPLKIKGHVMFQYRYHTLRLQIQQTSIACWLHWELGTLKNQSRKENCYQPLSAAGVSASSRFLHIGIIHSSIIL